VFYQNNHVAISMGDGTVVSTWLGGPSTPNRVNPYNASLDGPYVGWYLP